MADPTPGDSMPQSKVASCTSRELERALVAHEGFIRLADFRVTGVHVEKLRGAACKRAGHDAPGVLDEVSICRGSMYSIPYLPPR